MLIGSNSLSLGPEDLNARLSELVNANFDLRKRIFNVAPENRRMVMTARSAGASAKFAGSGGAIFGLYEDEAQFKRLSMALSSIGCTTIKPTIAVGDEKLETISTNWRDA